MAEANWRELYMTMPYSPILIQNDGRDMPAHMHETSLDQDS